MTIISTSVTVPGQPSPRFHVEAWLPFRNCEMVYWLTHDVFFFVCCEPLKLKKKTYCRAIKLAVNLVLKV